MKAFKLLFSLLFSMPFFCLSQDVYELKWGSGNDYTGALIVNEQEEFGVARIKWADKMIEQRFILEFSKDQEVMILDGYHPVYPGTDNSHPTYNADNFYITWENGVYSCLNIDDGNSISKVRIRKINGTKAVKNKFLKEFGMSVNK